MTPETLLIISALILLIPLFGFVLLVFFGKKIGKPSAYIGTAILGIDLALALWVFFSKLWGDFAEVASDGVTGLFVKNGLIQYKFTWFSIAGYDFNVGIGVDNLAAIMLIVVTLISFLVHMFSIEYMHGDKRYSRFYAYLGIFTFSMLGIVLANNFLFMYVFWELVGLSSYLLIGFWYEKDSAANAGKKAFLTNRIGDLGFFIGIMILFTTYGSVMFDDIFAGISSGLLPFNNETMLTLAGIFIFCGAIGKSAQFPLHVWLPDAMEGPTPVSALIHAATMVAAGVYLVARVFPMFTAGAFTFIAFFGAITAFISATIAITQVDFKRVLAYSTVSQLGYMIMALGVGAYTTGFFHLVTHAWFKAALFLCSGSVIHAMHIAMHHAHNHDMDPQDIRNMGGLRKNMKLTYYTFLLATLAISGVPLTSGFLSKDGILAATLAFAQLTGGLNWFIPIIGFGAAGMTAFYMFRLAIVAFHGKPSTDIAAHTKENKFVIVFPLILLVVLSAWIFYSPDPTDAHAGWFYEKLIPPETAVHTEGLQFSHLLPMHGVEAELSSHGAEAGEHSVHAYRNLFEEQMHHAHLPAMILSIIIAGFGILLAFMIYQFKIFNADNLQKQFAFLHRFSLNKWYFDELYAKTFIGGTVGLAKVLGLFDNYVIDGLVNLSAAVTRVSGQVVGIFDNVVIDGLVNLLANVAGFFGAFFRKFQTGNVQTYVIMAIVAIMTLIYFVI
jgi:NADH-quinone oxidoreductase subunit L